MKNSIYNLDFTILVSQGSLIANMLLGIILLKKKYSLREYVSIVLISIGICICTLASATEKTSTTTKGDEENFDLFWWIVGKNILLKLIKSLNL